MMLKSKRKLVKGEKDESLLGGTEERSDAFSDHAGIGHIQHDADYGTMDSRIPEFPAPPALDFADRLGEPRHQYQMEEPTLDAQFAFEDLPLDRIIIGSALWDVDPKEQARKIAHAFNLGKPSIMTKSDTMGSRIPQDKFLIVAENNIPELVLPSPQKMRLKWTLDPGKKREKIATIDQIKPYFHAHGVHLLNISRGKYALAYSGTIPIILGEGPHVIHDQNFRCDEAKAFVDQSDPYIQHGTIYIIRVPKGKIAKVWHGSKPYFLEARKEPYVINDSLFRLEKKSQNEFFEDASAQLIAHGSLKRLMPRTGEVAITYDNGVLKIFSPSDDSKPILIKSARHIVDGFLPTNTQTLVFPSGETVRERKQARPRDTNVDYEVFRTQDGLPIGVKLLVVFNVSDPEVLLKNLPKSQIVQHIENIVVADMGAVIQQCTSNDFQNTAQTKARMPLIPPADPSIPSAPEFIRDLQDKVKNQLVKDFREIGINLVRLNIETPQILDEDIAKKMSANALETSHVQTKKALLDARKEIIQQEAEQEASKIRIKQTQENEQLHLKAEAEKTARMTKAQAELEAARLEAEAKQIKAEAEAKATVVKAESEAKAKLKMAEAESQAKFRMAEALAAEAKVLVEFPIMAQYRLAQLISDAMHGVKTAILSPEQVPGMYSLGLQNLFFSQMRPQATEGISPSPDVHSSSDPADEQRIRLSRI